MLKLILQKIIDFFFYLIPFPKPSMDHLKQVAIVAHRGWHNNEDILENTMPAFELAYQNGLQGIEFDIRWTKDLVPVIHHDPKLVRIFGSEQNLCELSFSELRQRFPQIPALAEVVKKYGGKIHFFIELKQEHYPNLIKQKEILKQILADIVVGRDFHFICLDEAPLEQFNLYPRKFSILVAQFNIHELSRLAIEHDWGGVMGHYLLFTQSLIDEQKQAGKITGSGFAASRNCFFREVNRGLDFIFTNHPWVLIKNLKEFNH